MPSAAEKAAHILGRGIARCGAALAGAEMGGKIREIARIGGKRVRAGAALGGEHVQEQLDQAGVGDRVAGTGHRGALNAASQNLSGGIETVISRGFGSNQLASTNMPP